MKVLEERKPFENWTMQVDCNGRGWEQFGKVPCASTLEIDINDVLKRSWAKYPDYAGTDYGFICPVCGCFTIIEESKLTKDLKNMAKDYQQ